MRSLVDAELISAWDWEEALWQPELVQQMFLETPVQALRSRNGVDEGYVVLGALWVRCSGSLC